MKKLTEEQIKAISDCRSYIWNTLRRFEDPEYPRVYVNKEAKSLSYIEMPDDINISKTAAYTQINRWVEKEIRAGESIYLYSCPDNTIIRLESKKEFTAEGDENLDLFDEIIPMYLYHWED